MSNFVQLTMNGSNTSGGGTAPALSLLLPRLDGKLMIEILQIVTTETPMFVIPIIGLLALGLAMIGIIVFIILRRRGTGSLGQDDYWLQE